MGPPAKLEGSSCPTYSPALAIASLFNYIWSRCAGLPYLGLSSHVPCDHWCWATFHVLIDHWQIFREASVHISCAWKICLLIAELEEVFTCSVYNSIARCMVNIFSSVFSYTDSQSCFCPLARTSLLKMAGDLLTTKSNFQRPHVSTVGQYSTQVIP